MLYIDSSSCQFRIEFAYMLSNTYKYMKTPSVWKNNRYDFLIYGSAVTPCIGYYCLTLIYILQTGLNVLTSISN